jgi:hypothetical protein
MTSDGQVALSFETVTKPVLVLDYRQGRGFDSHRPTEPDATQRTGLPQRQRGAAVATSKATGV